MARLRTRELILHFHYELSWVPTITWLEGKRTQWWDQTIKTFAWLKRGNDDDWLAKQASLLIYLNVASSLHLLRHSVATIPNIIVLWFACCKIRANYSKTGSLFSFTIDTSLYTIELLEFHKVSWPILLKLYCMYAIKYAIFLFSNKHYVISNQILRLFELQASQI